VRLAVRHVLAHVSEAKSFSFPAFFFVVVKQSVGVHTAAHALVILPKAKGEVLL
jgi:hypothetical protein